MLGLRKGWRIGIFGGYFHNLPQAFTHCLTKQAACANRLSHISKNSPYMCKHYLHLAKSVILGHSETKCAVPSISGCYYYLFSYCITFNENPFLSQFRSHCTVTKLNDSSCTNELKTQVTACFNNKCIQNFCLS